MKKMYPFRNSLQVRGIIFNLLLLVFCTASALKTVAQTPVQVGTGTSSTLYGPIYI
jgi:hypothetical protein